MPLILCEVTRLREDAEQKGSAVATWLCDTSGFCSQPLARDSHGRLMALSRDMFPCTKYWPLSLVLPVEATLVD